MFVNMLLLKALGKNHEGLPQSVKGLLEEATRDMKTIAGKPSFKPEYDPVILTLPWPGSSSRRTGNRARRRRASTPDAAIETAPGRKRSPSCRSRTSPAYRDKRRACSAHPVGDLSIGLPAVAATSNRIVEET
jgi:hypothetical protein